MPRLPTTGTPNSDDADADDQRGLHEADDDIGHDLAEHDLDRRDRHRQQAFHGAALDLARHRQRGEDQHGHGEDGADQARHDVELGHAGRVVTRMGADFERQRRCCRERRGRARARSAAPGRARRAPCRRRPDRWRRPRPAWPACRRAAPRARNWPGFRWRTAPCPRPAVRRPRLRCAAARVTLKYLVFSQRRQDRAARDRCAPAAAPRSADGAALVLMA